MGSFQNYAFFLLQEKSSLWKQCKWGGRKLRRRKQNHRRRLWKHLFSLYWVRMRRIIRRALSVLQITRKLSRMGNSIYEPNNNEQCDSGNNVGCQGCVVQPDSVEMESQKETRNVMTDFLWETEMDVTRAADSKLVGPVPPFTIYKKLTNVGSYDSDIN